MIFNIIYQNVLNILENLFIKFLCPFPQVMELETAVQVSTNQMKRQEEENKRLQEALDAAETNIRTMQTQLGDHKRKYTDLESQVSKLTCIKYCIYKEK